jgi:hypothetical protein
MSGLVQYLEEMIVAFVKERVPIHEWKHIYSRNHIEGKMEDDDVNELKDYCFDELMNEVNWNVVVDHIRELVREQTTIENDSESVSESEGDSEGDYF